MATQSWSTRVRHDSDVFFREWGSELSAKLTAAGLVQTADTGQINWVTVVRTGVNTDTGYEIWKLNDALVTSAPAFFRINYGTGSNSTGPRIRIQHGTSTDGAGVLGGTTSGTNAIGSFFASANTDTARQSFLCVTEGFFGLYYKLGSVSIAEGLFLYSRTVDSTGTPTVTGAMVNWSQGVSAAMSGQSFRYAATAVAYTRRTVASTLQMCLVPMVKTSSIANGFNQAYLCWTITPQVEPLNAICGVFDGEVPVGNTFTATLVGTTPHTYIGLGIANIDVDSVVKPAMLWE